MLDGVWLGACVLAMPEKHDIGDAPYWFHELWICDILLSHALARRGSCKANMIRINEVHIHTFCIWPHVHLTICAWVQIGSRVHVGLCSVHVANMQIHVDNGHEWRACQKRFEHEHESSDTNRKFHQNRFRHNWALCTVYSASIFWMLWRNESSKCHASQYYDDFFPFVSSSKVILRFARRFRKTFERIANRRIIEWQNWFWFGLRFIRLDLTSGGHLKYTKFLNQWFRLRVAREKKSNFF